jgi:hypothetical protein
MKKLIYAAAAGILLAAPAHAQDDATPPPYRTLVTVNPLGLLTNYYNVEVERALSNVTSLSVAFERSTADDDNTTAGDVRFRYYPQARVFSGVALGASLGYGRFNEDADDGEFDPNDDDDKMSGPTLGLEIDYSWLVGRDRRLYVGLGFGARRLLSGGSDDGDDPILLPGARYFGIGYTF